MLSEVMTTVATVVVVLKVLVGHGCDSLGRAEACSDSLRNRVCVLRHVLGNSPGEPRLLIGPGGCSFRVFRGDASRFHLCFLVSL